MYTPHLLVTFGGALTEFATNDEIWQCGVRCSFEEPFDEGLYVEEIGDNLATWFSDPLAGHPAATTLRWLKAARIASDGNYPTPTYDAPEAAYATPVAGGSGTATMPSFCCVALSWLSTDHARGPASHGRIYPPNFAVPLSTGSAKISSGWPENLVQSGQAVLTAIQNADNTQIVSPGIYSKIGGAASVITHVRVGNVVDTQRRRKNATGEAYVGGTFPA